MSKEIVKIQAWFLAQNSLSMHSGGRNKESVYEPVIEAVVRKGDLVLGRSQAESTFSASAVLTVGDGCGQPSGPI